MHFLFCCWELFHYNYQTTRNAILKLFQFSVLYIRLLTASSYGLIHYTGNLLYWSRSMRNVRTGIEFYFYICTWKHLISQGWNLNKYGKMKLILRFVRDALKQMARELNVLYQTTVEY